MKVIGYFEMLIKITDNNLTFGFESDHKDKSKETQMLQEMPYLFKK